MKLTEMDSVQPWTGGMILGPGWHDVVITSAEEGTSSGGFDQVELEYETPDGSGQIREWLVVTKQSKGKLKGLLDAAGVEAQGGEWEFDPKAQLLGKRVGIHVHDEPDYNDPTKTKSKVDAHRAFGQPTQADDLPGSQPAQQKAEDDIPF